MHPAFSYSCITLDKIRDMAKKKHKGHYCKICGEYKPNESFSRKGHVQHICKECMGEMKKSNKKILDLPFGDNEFEIVDADEYIDTILYGNNEERENKTFKKLSREQKMVLKAIVQDEVTFYWQAHRHEAKQIEGTRNSSWVLMDYGDMIIHIFDEENRLFYDLERIWRDGKILDAEEFLGENE